MRCECAYCVPGGASGKRSSVFGGVNKEIGHWAEAINLVLLQPPRIWCGGLRSFRHGLMTANLSVIHARRRASRYVLFTRLVSSVRGLQSIVKHGNVTRTLLRGRVRLRHAG